MMNQQIRVSQITLKESVPIDEVLEVLKLLGFNLSRKRRVDYVEGTYSHAAIGENLSASEAMTEIAGLAKSYGKSLLEMAQILKVENHPEGQLAVAPPNFEPVTSAQQREQILLQQNLETNAQFATLVAPAVVLHAMEEMQAAQLRVLQDPEIMTRIYEVTGRYRHLSTQKKMPDGTVRMLRLEEMVNESTADKSTAVLNPSSLPHATQAKLKQQNEPLSTVAGRLLPTRSAGEDAP